MNTCFPFVTNLSAISASLPHATQRTHSSRPEAAKYLGISKSTLYRYACQQTIESRKLGGRLEYHRSTLDGFKNRQIRPARRYVEPGGIITAALGSGK